MLQTYSDFVKAHPPSLGVTVRVSERTLHRVREALGLSADAEMPEIQTAMDLWTAEARDQAATRKLVAVARTGAPR